MKWYVATGFVLSTTAHAGWFHSDNDQDKSKKKYKTNFSLLERNT